MLHKVPESSERDCLLAVVEMQRLLLEALCSLLQGSIIDEAWLYTVWSEVPVQWIKRFWKNDNGNR
jgi:hypothetical protein